MAASSPAAIEVAYGVSAALFALGLAVVLTRRRLYERLGGAGLVVVASGVSLVATERLRGGEAGASALASLAIVTAVASVGLVTAIARDPRRRP